MGIYKTIRKYILLLMMYCIASPLRAQVIVPLDHPYISYDGVYYPEISATKVVLNRHLASMIDNEESGISGDWIHQWVITQTGIRIRFKTASPTIDLSFTQRDGGGTIGETPANGFASFVNGVQREEFSKLNFTVNHPNPGIVAVFEVSLPNLWAVDFTGMKLEEGYSLLDPGLLNKPVYVAIGNSITHGTGQYVSSSETYPFVLAGKKGWDLHNIAVAGATLGWAVALNIKGKPVDYITVHLGYNDWNSLKDSLSIKKTEYGKLLDSLRAYQPQAKIYCITPIYTADESGAAPYSLDDFRAMMNDVVTAKQQKDHLLCLINGPDISDESMLASGDPTHLSPFGAIDFANNLSDAISSCMLTGINDAIVEENKQLQILYANKTQIQISTKAAGDYVVLVYNTTGTVVFSKEINLGNAGLNTLSWPGISLNSGLYLIKIVGDKSVSSVKKVVLE